MPNLGSVQQEYPLEPFPSLLAAASVSYLFFSCACSDKFSVAMPGKIYFCKLAPDLQKTQARTLKWCAYNTQ